jgi:hypothetical protein
VERTQQIGVAMRGGDHVVGDRIWHVALESEQHAVRQRLIDALDGYVLRPSYR